MHSETPGSANQPHLSAHLQNRQFLFSTNKVSGSLVGSTPGPPFGLVVPISNSPKTTGLDQFDSTASSLLHPGCGLEWVVQFLDYLWGITLGHGLVVSGVFGVAGSATPGGGLSATCVHMVPPELSTQSPVQCVFL